MNAAESRMAGNRSVLVIDSSSETDTVCPPRRAFAHAIDGDRARPLALSSAGPRPAARASVHIRLAPTVSGSRPEPSAVHPTWCGTVESAASLEPTVSVSTLQRHDSGSAPAVRRGPPSWGL
jgi:hypothetical protein